MQALLLLFLCTKSSVIDYKKEAGTKVLASQLSLDYRARRSG